MVILVTIGCLVLGVPVRCSYFTLAVVLAVGGVSFSAMAVLLGCRTEKAETAVGLINLTFIPQVLLSGVFFSAEKFPHEIQPILKALPLRQMNDCLREVMLEGKNLYEVKWHLLILTGYGIVCFLLAMKWFRWR
jgi:ABC-2 type transport system permease protein